MKLTNRFKGLDLTDRVPEELSMEVHNIVQEAVIKTSPNKKKYSENENITQSNLQIQCNPYQATSGIFHRARTNNLTICMEIQKTSNSQSNLEKEEWNWRNQPACLQALLQSQSSRQYGTGTKTEI